MNRTASLVVLVVLLFSLDAAAQVFVFPRRADKSLVRYDDFEWYHVDILVGPEADRIEGGSIPRPVGVPPVPGSPEAEDGPRGTPVQSRSPGGRDEWTRSGPWAPGGWEAAASSPETGTPEAAPEGVPGEGNEDAPSAPADAPSAPGGGVMVGPPPPSPAPTASPNSGPPEAWRRELGPGAGGVRLYFYESEREVAERAVPLITNAYRYLVEQFDYVPTRTFPYILYNTYQEYLQTNLFPLSEGTLGVTSPVDLKLTLPYFGDERFFDLVSTHELAHQFTIQKVKTRAELEKTSDPLMGLPLWFIEGIAEYYAQRGMDPEAEMLVRDLVVNPSFEQGYVLQDFFAEGPYGFLWIYKMGQARCAFLEETYGAGTIQRVLEQSPSLVANGQAGPGRMEGGFPGLLRRVTRDPPRVIAAKFESWLKRRGYTTYLGASQNADELEPLENVPGIADALASSPDGTLVLVRTIEPETGQSRLHIMDPRDPDSRETVAEDGVPGVESLHVVFGRNFAVRADRLVFIAESKSRDVLYVQRFTHEAERHELPREPLNRGTAGSLIDRPGGPTTLNLPPGTGAPPPAPPATGQPWWEADIDLGDREAIRLSKFGIVAAYSPAFSPDGRRVAFIGLSNDGTRDVFVIDIEGTTRVARRLTQDTHAERQLTWGGEGIVYTSDATAHGKHNLFRIRPEPGAAPERLTTEPRDEQDPVVLPDGRLLFVAFEHGKADVFELTEGAIVRRTDIGTGLFDLGPGLDGGLWTLVHEEGRRRPVRFPKEKLLALERAEQLPGEGANGFERVSLQGAQRYEPLRLSNWEMGPILGLVGGGTGGIAGQVFASATDRLRNHAVLLQASVFGSFRYSDGILAYLNQESRVFWGMGLFQSLRFRVDQSPLPDGGAPFLFTSAERFWGVLGTARYPFNRFVYVQGDVAVGGVNYFLGNRERFLLSDRYFTPSGADLRSAWEALNGGTRLQTEATVSLGYDTLRYHYATGPIDGSSVLLEFAGGWQPTTEQTFGNTRLDAETYFPLIGRSNFLLRLGSGSSVGGRYARQFYLSSFDTLRGVEFGDVNWLLGRHYLYSTAELQVPLNALIRFVLLSDVEGIAGFDMGGVANRVQDLWSRRVANAVVGFNFGLGPILFRLHFAKPLLIGGGAIAPTPNARWVTNFSIGLAGLGSFYGKNTAKSAAPQMRPASMLR